MKDCLELVLFFLFVKILCLDTPQVAAVTQDNDDGNDVKNVKINLELIL